MRSRVSTRARMRDERNGDPLDGLVNLFDLGLVLALAFLLVAINSLDADTVQPTAENEVKVSPDEQVGTVPQTGGEQVIGQGQEVGKVYRLDDGRLVYVAPKEP